MFLNDLFIPPLMMSQPRRNIVILFTSFVQALNNVIDFALVSLQNLVSKVTHYQLKFLEELHQRGLENFKSKLHGKVTMQKGDKPLKLNNLHFKLVKL